MTSIAVVLAVGARLNGQASRGTWTFNDDVAVPRERRFDAAGQRNDFDRKPLQRGQQAQQFLRLAGIAERQDHVAVVDDAHVAVQGVHAVELDARRTGAGERGGNFPADVAGFADADDDDFSALPERGDHQLHGAVEGFVQLRAHGLERGEFDVEHLAGLVEMAHARESVTSAAHFQPCFSRGNFSIGLPTGFHWRRYPEFFTVVSTSAQNRVKAPEKLRLVRVAVGRSVTGWI